MYFRILIFVARFHEDFQICFQLPLYTIHIDFEEESIE